VDEEAAFLRAIAEAPGDGAPRLVYADWLDERGDARGEYLRLLGAAAGWQEPNADRDPVVARLQQLGVGLDPDWKAAVQGGVDWRTLFEANLPPPERRESGEVYQLNPPATAEQLAAAERALGVRLPDDVRAMWSAFNGVRYTTRTDRRLGRDPEPYFLDLEGMPEATATMGQERRWAEIFDEVYGPGTFGRLLLIRYYDGGAQAWAVCLDGVAGHPAGTVVRHDHDTPDLDALAATLSDCVRRRFTDRFSHW
jgi:uncharacterized protein (TIGR02996 family)